MVSDLDELPVGEAMGLWTSTFGKSFKLMIGSSDDASGGLRR
jgi:hypothetical protein